MKSPIPRSSSKTKPRETASFSFGSSQPYADNAEYAAKALLFHIVAISFESGRGFDGNDRWAVTVEVEGREREILTLGANPKRDKQLRAAQAHLKRHGVIKDVRLRRSGSAYYFTSKDE